jgi:hypothetical protein
MTDQSEGRDDSSAVAALAIELNRARREIDSLTSKLDHLTAAQRRHSTVLSDIAKIRQQIQQILTLLNTENEASPARWFWLTMPDDEREAKSLNSTTGSSPSCASSTPTTWPTRSSPAGPTISKPTGNSPGYTNSGLLPT